MQREIKFRGQMVDNREWVYGGSIIKFDDKGIVTYFMASKAERCMATHDNETDNITSIEGNFYKVENICQFTGLKDENGKEIFEGDMLQDEEGVFLVRFDEENCGFVLDDYGIQGRLLEHGWDEAAGGFGVVDTYRFNDFCNGTQSLPPVTGNIHDNPELLQEGRKDE